MDTLLQPPVATTFDAVSSLVSAVALPDRRASRRSRARRGTSRARVFLAIALASAAPYWSRRCSGRAGPAPLSRCRSWRHGRPVADDRQPALLPFHAGLSVAAAVDPRARPLARRAATLRRADRARSSLWVVEPCFGDRRRCRHRVGRPRRRVGRAVGESLLLLLLVVPGALRARCRRAVRGPAVALQVLARGESRRASESARVTTFWMLISQMAGGVLTILIIPLLRLVAPTGSLGDDRGRAAVRRSAC